METQKSIKTEGGKNDLLDRIAADPAFRLSAQDLKRLLNLSDFVGLAPRQASEFIDQTIDPLLEKGLRYGAAVRHEIKV
jgi:adenylosuccinate lyase